MLSLEKKIKTIPYQNILQYLSNDFLNFLIEHKLKHVIVVNNTICYFFGYFRKLFKMFLLINRKNIIVVYCSGTEFVKFTVREIKD